MPKARTRRYAPEARNGGATESRQRRRQGDDAAKADSGQPPADRRPAVVSKTLRRDVLVPARERRPSGFLVQNRARLDVRVDSAVRCCAVGWTERGTPLALAVVGSATPIARGLSDMSLSNRQRRGAFKMCWADSLVDVVL
jgi:hypothetical protein